MNILGSVITAKASFLSLFNFFHPALSGELFLILRRHGKAGRKIVYFLKSASRTCTRETRSML